MPINLHPAMFLPLLHLSPLLGLLAEAVALTWNLTLLGSVSVPLRLVQRLTVKVPGIATVVISSLAAFWRCPSLCRVSTVDPGAGAATPSAGVAVVGPTTNAPVAPTRCIWIPS